MKPLIVAVLASLASTGLGAWQYTREVDPFTDTIRHIIRWNAEDATLSLQCDSGSGERREVRLLLTVPAVLDHPLADIFVQIDDAEAISAGVWFVRSTSRARTLTEAYQAILFLRKLDSARRLGLRVMTTDGPLTVYFDVGHLASAKEQLKPHCIVEYPIL